MCIRDRYNVEQIRAMVGKDVKIAAVVKANGYGHGAVGIAPTIMEHGGDLLCVATLSEAIELKRAYPQYPVLIMGCLLYTSSCLILGGSY